MEMRPLYRGLELNFGRREIGIQEARFSFTSNLLTLLVPTPKTLNETKQMMQSLIMRSVYFVVGAVQDAYSKENFEKARGYQRKPLITIWLA